MKNALSDLPSIMLKCACHGEAIELSYWDEDDGEFWFAIWKHGFDNRLCWREKIRWCWNIIRTGKPWGDNIILTPEQAQQVALFINQHLTPPKNGQETKKP